MSRHCIFRAAAKIYGFVESANHLPTAAAVFQAFKKFQSFNHLNFVSCSTFD